MMPPEPNLTEHHVLTLDSLEGGPGPWESYLDDSSEVEDVERLRTVLHWPLLES
jgi:hypothetical protein